MNTFGESNFSASRHSKPHCQKCGRRSRNHHTNVTRRRMKSEHQHFLPKELPLYPTLTRTNDNHSQNQSVVRKVCDRKSSDNDVLIDQFIQVQQVDPFRRNHCSDGKSDYRTLKNMPHSKHNLSRWHHVQPIVYLRENINNLSYRELHFAHQYIVLKRVEEKNGRINQNRCKVDHHLRPLRLQYQMRSLLFQNAMIDSFTFPKQDTQQSEVLFNASVRGHADEYDRKVSHDVIKHPPAVNDRSTSSTSELNDAINGSNTTKFSQKLTMTDPSNSLTLITPYNEYNPQQSYSQNAVHSPLSIDHTLEAEPSSAVYDTAVTIDITKCASMTPTLFHPWPQNSNYTYQTQPTADNYLHNPLQHPSSSNISQETAWFSPEFSPSNAVPMLSRSESEQSSSLAKSDATSTNETSDEKNSGSTKCTQTMNKIKEILTIIQANLLRQSQTDNRTIPSGQRTAPPKRKSPSTVMTSDSLMSDTNLQATYSVSSTISILNRIGSRILSSQSTVDFEDEVPQTEIDSLNSIYDLNKDPSHIELLNLARNINRNQHESDDDDDDFRDSFHDDQIESRTHWPSRRIQRYMSPSFMRILQILLITCLLNQMLMYGFFGSEPSDTLMTMSDKSQSVTAPSSAAIGERDGIAARTYNQLFNDFVSLFALFI